MVQHRAGRQQQYAAAWLKYKVYLIHVFNVSGTGCTLKSELCKLLLDSTVTY